ncbi:hypothetical protein, conserved [Trypanosoma brucei gambiense DAL972]|uniref:Leucine-rich repeat protein (LRRP) n=2 Tax=Trypanosoma brucei TaxID=5691 RepID=D0A5Z5_TRYB9|nr:hypothetical protein, conserved [Trypanosoma brucei gambiense DAL972]CBH17096.1 hypothetical protein, conserved [Trypanosoma brucei gambiense DAL972]|eukprot:XP_011779360.1 hypothetical protein, conserved [Trypanosoma brucei gambiense DAL972]
MKELFCLFTYFSFYLFNFSFRASMNHPDELEGSATSGVLCPLTAYEEVPPTKTRSQIIKEQLLDLENYSFEIPDRPEGDPSGKLAYLDMCEQLHKESFMKFPTHSVANSLCEGKESLDVSFFALGKKGSAALAAALRVNLTIRKLSLLRNHITPSGAMEIARALSETKVVSDLDLSENLLGLTDADDIQGGAVVAEFLKPGNVLKTLSLRDNKLSDQHVTEFAEAAIDNTELHSLDLSFNRIGYIGAIELANILSKNADLQEINLEWNQFQTIGSRHILAEGLLLNNTIKRFNMSWNGLDDACGVLVGRIISENDIEEIVVAHNRIGPAGAEAIAKGLLNTSALTTLILDDNPMQNEGCAAILRVVGEAATLTNVSLQQCRCDSSVVLEADRLMKEVRPDLDIRISEGCCAKVVM